jgi:UDP-N-acetylmuramoylalanine-D-glutamate ligase
MNVREGHSDSSAARSGLAAARFLAARGARVVLNDIRPKDELTEAIRAGSCVNVVAGDTPMSSLKTRIL